MHNSGNMPRTWQDVAMELCNEMNPAKLLMLAKELNDLLEIEHARKHALLTRQPVPAMAPSTTTGSD